MITRVLVFIAALATSLGAAAAWRYEAAASRLAFLARFQGNAVPGRFTDFDVALDGATPAGARLVVTVRTASAAFDSAEVTSAVRDAAWFDVARFPEARFEARALEGLGGDRYLAHGTLALKGVQRELDVPIVWHETAQGAALSGEFAVERGWFGIGSGEFAGSDEVAAEVHMSFDVRLRRDE